MHIQFISTLEDTMQRTATFVFYKTRKKIAFCKNEFIYPREGNMCESKKEITNFCNKLFMKVNIPVEFNREKYNLNFKSHAYKIKAITKTSTNTHLKEFVRFLMMLTGNSSVLLNSIQKWLLGCFWSFWFV